MFVNDYLEPATFVARSRAVTSSTSKILKALATDIEDYDKKTIKAIALSLASKLDAVAELKCEVIDRPVEQLRGPRR